MNNTELFNKICYELNGELQFLNDKPEETVESTVKALWFLSAGIPVSAEKAIELTIPKLSEIQIEKLHHLIQLRRNNIPLAHITKRQRFMGIELIADERALIPRKETEILGKKALELSQRIGQSKSTINVFDVCCGSGNLGIALAQLNPKCKVFASDISEEAVTLTRENIEFLTQKEQIEARQSDLFSAFETGEFFEKMDLIVCNPPYIFSSTVKKMNDEIVQNEPILAFDGGMLGIKILQRLIREAPKFLLQNGWLIFEIGLGQGDFISQLCEKSHLYKNIETVKDDSDNIRVIMVQKAL